MYDPAEESDLNYAFVEQFVQHADTQLQHLEQRTSTIKPEARLLLISTAIVTISRSISTFVALKWLKRSIHLYTSKIKIPPWFLTVASID